MEKIPKTQIFKTAILFAFLLVIPFISSSLRTSYLYFILNLLILFLAIESGVLAAASEPIDDKTKHTLLHPYLTSPLFYNNSNLINLSTNATTVKTLNDCNSTMGEKPTTTRTMLGLAIAPVVEQNILKKCPSRPSLFFIGGLEEEKEEITVQEEVRSLAKIDDFNKKKNKKTEEEENDDDDDLFLRAEMFIGNFYKQLKIQREDSWKRIHGICRKAL